MPAATQHQEKHMPPITCAACDDTDGPFKNVDGTHLCESCLAITDGAK